MTQVVERRKFGRFEISVPVRMTLGFPSGDCVVLDVHTRNISREGMTVEVDITDDRQRVTNFVWDKLAVEASRGIMLF